MNVTTRRLITVPTVSGNLYYRVGAHVEPRRGLALGIDLFLSVTVLEVTSVDDSGIYELATLSPEDLSRNLTAAGRDWCRAVVVPMMEQYMADQRAAAAS